MSLAKAQLLHLGPHSLQQPDKGCTLYITQGLNATHKIDVLFISTFTLINT